MPARSSPRHARVSPDVPSAVTGPPGESTDPMSAAVSTGSVVGRIVVAGTGRGVQGLLVEAFHVEGSVLRRLASASTRADGTFRVSLPAAPRRSAMTRPERATWNLQLHVLGPERRGTARRSRILFRTELRRTAAFQEEYLIELTERQLRAAKIAETASATAGESLASSVRAASDRTKAIRQATDEITAERLKEIGDRRSVLRGKVVTGCAASSRRSLRKNVSRTDSYS